MFIIILRNNSLVDSKLEVIDSFVTKLIPKLLNQFKQENKDY